MLVGHTLSLPLSLPHPFQTPFLTFPPCLFFLTLSLTLSPFLFLSPPSIFPSTLFLPLPSPPFPPPLPLPSPLPSTPHLPPSLILSLFLIFSFSLHPPHSLSIPLPYSLLVSSVNQSYLLCCRAASSWLYKVPWGLRKLLNWIRIEYKIGRASCRERV